MNLDKLRELCNKFTVEASFNGFEPFTQKVIDAEKMLLEIDTTSELPKEVFISNINRGDFMTKEYESIFKSIKRQGTFKIKGYENLSGNAYIECNSLNWL
jgi:hypothetical protein